MTEHKRNDYPDSGILFSNDHKNSERDPDHRGSGNLDCPKCGHRIELWLSAWRRQGRKAGEFISVSFRPKDHAAAERKAEPQSAPREHDTDPSWFRR